MYATEASADREWAHHVGFERQNVQWILSDRDAWYQNPFYTGPQTPHPDADFECDEEYEAACAALNFVGPHQVNEVSEDFFALDDDIPF